VKDYNHLLALNFIWKRLCIPLDCDFLAPLYFLFTEVVKNVGQSSTILSDLLLSAVGQRFLLVGNASRKEIATNRLGVPRFRRCGMTSRIQLRLAWPLLLRIARCVVAKPGADTLTMSINICK
jgi:hypothetical protein